MIGFFKKLFGAKPVETQPEAAPYKVETPTPAAEKATEAVVASIAPAKPKAPKKPNGPKKQGGNKPRKPKAPKKPQA